MNAQGTVTVSEVIQALRELGGEADSDEIKKRVIAKRNNVLPHEYDSWASYRKTIDQLVHYHCPQCKKFLGKEIYFQQVRRGRYLLVEDGNHGVPRKLSAATKQKTPSAQKTIHHRPVRVVAVVSEEDDELAFPEGKEVYQLHRAKERNSKIVACVKVKKLKIDSLLRCEVCGFSFVEKFGELGKGFIEAHHMIPVSQLSENTLTKEKDIVLVCSNCHRMLHRYRPWLSVAELKSVLFSKHKRAKAAR